MPPSDAGRTSTTASLPRPAWPYLVIGAVCGLTWAAALRGWMEQLAAGTGGSTFTWLTEGLLLVPATLVGLLLGRAAHHRACGTPAPRALIWAPALLATAIADPSIFHALITNGEGGGSLGVVITALCGGFTLSRRRWTIARALTALTAALGLAFITAMGSMAASGQTARGVWVCLLGFSLMLLLSLAAVLPYPPTHAPLAPGWYVALGGLTGLAWAAGVRGILADLAGADSVVRAADTFGYLLLPGTVAGALLGWAEYLRRHGDHSRRVLLASGPCGLLVVGIWLSLGTSGATTPGSAVSTPRGLWFYLAVAGLAALLAVAVRAPLRAAPVTVRPPAGTPAQPAISAPSSRPS